MEAYAISAAFDLIDIRNHAWTGFRPEYAQCTKQTGVEEVTRVTGCGGALGDSQ